MTYLYVIFTTSHRSPFFFDEDIKNESRICNLVHNKRCIWNK